MLLSKSIKIFSLSSITLVLVAGCGGGSSSSSNQNTDNEAVVPTNSAPVANAGSDQTIQLGSVLELSASQSSDADGDTLTIEWSLTSVPEGSVLTIENNTLEQLSLSPDIIGDYVFSLTVNDGTVNSAPDEVVISVTPESTSNQAPVANAGAAQNTNVDEIVNLTAENSFDPDGDPLSFTWTVTSKPDGSLVKFDGDDFSQQNISFTPDATGEYLLTLEVNDGLASNTAMVTVNASANNLDITDKIFVERSTSCSEYVGTYQSNVDDIKRGISFHGNVSISSNSTECTIDINQIPNHSFNDQSAAFATNVGEVIDSYRINIAPAFSGTDTALELGVAEAVMLNGVTLDILPAACYGVGDEPLGREKIGCGPDQNDNPWRYDPMSPLNTFGTDSHNAHTQPNGKYHYHANPVAMFAQNCENAVASPVIGFAADGFPIYGSCFTDPSSGEIRKAVSSYALKNNGGPREEVVGYQTPQAGVGLIASNNYDGQFRGDWEYVQGTGDLDQCNGMTVDGKYGYYVTNTFPWVINCFKGQINNSFARSEELERRSHSHAGETHSH
ncbi:YHYH protein [Thalassotalea sp. M1531]|uniref:YHYH protein n=1 Tax=Thalassotalea algicola TaxID=2716224 RepID=A0A7Y0LAX8_9GAMM|nr:YHYH protein [Thalassotalea algicola]NMP31076.1 YHYH protein [Thalassotalea algicola]